MSLRHRNSLLEQPAAAAAAAAAAEEEEEEEEEEEGGGGGGGGGEAKRTLYCIFPFCFTIVLNGSLHICPWTREYRNTDPTAVLTFQAQHPPLVHGP
jgi:hypothetical protein